MRINFFGTNFGLSRLNNMKMMTRRREMQLLQKLKKQANQAYIDVVNCSDYRRKETLLEKYHRVNAKYHDHRQWLQALES